MSSKQKPVKKINNKTLLKCPTGIAGLDDITFGGLPQGRPTLVCGSAGCGKTLLGIEFLLRGAMEFDEPGVFMSFEENEKELAENVISLGFDLQALKEHKKIVVDHVRIERAEIEETGQYDLEGLFIRLGYAIDSIKAKRVVLDTIEALFASFKNQAILRAELRRLFRWLKEKNVTAIITGEQGEKTLTRYGLEEYVADCVIFLDHRISDQLAIRRLRIVKYRGSTHGTNEYPFLIDETGISIMPLTSLRLNYDVSSARVSSGIKQLDEMLGGEGYFRGSSILVSGTAGTGKTSIASHFVNATCAAGKKCIYFAHEESPQQMFRDMKSIGIDLTRWIKKGLLHFQAERPTLYGLEMNLVMIYKAINKLRPAAVILDPISDLTAVGDFREVKQMLTRLLDFAKGRGVTALCTDLTSNASAPGKTEVGISSLMDTWILVQNLEQNGERNRGLYIMKSRGMEHSNQIREFILTSTGAKLIDVYAGSDKVLTGASRIAKEAEDAAAELDRKAVLEGKKRDLKRRKQTLEAQIKVLQSQFETEEEEINLMINREKVRDESVKLSRNKMSRVRDAN